MRSVAGQHFGQGLDDRLRHVGLVFGLRANAVQILQRAQCRQRILAQLADRAVCVLLGHVQHLRILQHGERVGFNRIVRNRALGRNTWVYIDEIYVRPEAA